MDVTPPGAAGTASRPSRTTPSGIPLVLRRLAIGLAGVALAVLAGAACALSFDDLRALAVSGRAEPRLAYLYPTAFDVLLVVALVSVPLLRAGRFLVRLQAGFVLLLLLASAAAADAATAAGVVFDPEATAVAVALLPWVMLAVGLWLLLILLKHARATRADLDGDSGDDDLVPFDSERTPRVPLAAPYPVAAEERDAPAPLVVEEHITPPLQPTPEAVAPPGYVPPLPVSPVSETVAPPEYAPPLPAAPIGHDAPSAAEDDVRLSPGTGPDVTPADEHADVRTAEESDEEPEPLPVVPPTAAPRTPPVTAIPPVESPSASAPEPGTTAQETQVDPAGERGPQPSAVEQEAAQAAQGPAEEADREPAPSHAAETPVVDTSVADVPGTPVADQADTEQVHTDQMHTDQVHTEQTPAEQSTAEEAAAPSPARADRPARPRRDRPVRWGDLVRPHTGDVLVHPRPKPEPEEPADEAGVDTQPLRQIRDVPDPAHAADAADQDEQGRRRAPYTAEGGEQSAAEPAAGSAPLPPPSGRMRSTPRPPD